MTRRSLCALLPAALARAQRRGLKIALGVGDYSDESLFFAGQLGVEWIDGPPRFQAEGAFRPLVPSPGNPPSGASRPWREDELANVTAKLKSFGLRLGITPMPPIPNALLGKPERDRDIETVHAAIALAARFEIPVIEYNFTALRASAGYYTVPGRGGSALRAFDYERIRHDPPFPQLGRVTREEMWDRLGYFLKAVLPVAERAGVKLAVHPNDPPVPEYRGVAQPLCTPGDLKQLVTRFPSPSNGITLDTGVTRECGEEPVAAIEWFGSRGRIHHVHFRNVRVETPRLNYTETFHDDGDIDMQAAMNALDRVGYPHLLVADHTPKLPGDPPSRIGGWSYAVGYMKGLAERAARSRP